MFHPLTSFLRPILEATRKQGVLVLLFCRPASKSISQTSTNDNTIYILNKSFYSVVSANGLFNDMIIQIEEQPGAPSRLSALERKSLMPRILRSGANICGKKAPNVFKVRSSLKFRGQESCQTSNFEIRSFPQCILSRHDVKGVLLPRSCCFRQLRPALYRLLKQQLCVEKYVSQFAISSFQSIY